ncbi:MAG: hypothetical protein IKO19_13460 [Candidatus Riflebacteria bacterium]|nr:hypothetical protein [Candidatus Riflebacteria bacterium]MBR4571660.1 hypothetical protein [Candidatus Riflebacteria bacterium]
MALTKEQEEFRNSAGYKVEDTFTNLKNNYFQPVMEEEKRIIEEHEKSLFGKVGCGGAFSYGCLIPMIAGMIIMSIPVFSQNPYAKTIVYALIFTLPEYFFVVWYNNTEFEDKHKGTSPHHVKVIRDLLLPFTGIISQDMKDDSKITLVTNLTKINSKNNELTDNQIREKGIAIKHGLSVYESDIMDLTATMADGTRINYNLHQLLNEVFVYKKRGSKHKSKGKITLKAVFAIPNKVYSALPEGQIKIGDYPALVSNSEKMQKIVIKNVYETTALDEAFIKDTAIDMMAAVYSVLS